MKTEHIVALKKANFLAMNDLEMNSITENITIDPQDVVVGHREYLDSSNNGKGDDSYLQGIGYAVILHPEKGILAYRRQGSEGRLDGKISIGFGGHTSAITDLAAVPGTEEIDFISTVNNGMARELKEELIIHGGELASPSIFLGVIACDRTAVDRLHIGLIARFMTSPGVTDVSLGDHGSEVFWIKEEDMKNVDLDDCEEWTKIIISELT